MVCTPTGIISTTDLINGDSLKETEGSQENPPADSRGDTEQHLFNSLLLLLKLLILISFSQSNRTINNYHKKTNK